MGINSCGTTLIDEGLFKNIGAITWDTTAKTAGFTAVAGNGYFVNTTSGAITVTLPATPTAGDVVGIADYANTADTNNITIGRNGSNIQGQADDFDINVEGTSILLVYVDATQGWLSIDAAKASDIIGPEYIVATGGTITTSGDFKIHTFTGPGTFTVCSVGNPAGSDTIDTVVVAGGAGGGYDRGGGGGAGGLRTALCQPVSGPTAYPITVGGGGSGGTGYPAAGGSGSNSIFSTITSSGGGGGSSCAGASTGGSGGGGRQAPSGIQSGAAGNTPPTSPPQGNPGGDATCGTNAVGAAGGGGGSSVAGSNGSPTGGGDGGAGTDVSSIISGTPNCGVYAGGGGGSRDQCGPAAPGGAGAGGVGGGGAGGVGAGGTGTPGTTNTGGGGGGGSNRPQGNGGNGGSGIVIIKYKFQ